MTSHAFRCARLVAPLCAVCATWSSSMHALTNTDAVVQLTSPAAGALVTGATMLQASVLPPNATSDVLFYVDGREVCRRSAPPFECEWDAGPTIRSHHVRLVVNLKGGGRIVRTARTESVAFAETVDVDVVQVTVTVTDEHGAYVKGLPRSAFQVFEDGKPQAISQFYADDAPLELVVCLDLSTSMRPALAEMKRTVSAFLTTLPAHHRLSLFGFNDTVFSLLPRHAPAAERAMAVNNLSAWGATALYEAVVEGVQSVAARPGRKAVLVFTDGADQGSHLTVEDTEGILHSSDSILYMIGQGQGVTSELLQGLMNRLARPTGGRTVSTTSISTLREAFRDLFDEMSHQYVLGYQAPGGVPDGQWREIEVKVAGGHKVRARQGYRKGSY